jgi:2-furoyl-CoA dehydrogenase large subunit
VALARAREHAIIRRVCEWRGGDVATTSPYLGRPVERLEDAELLTGRARFVDDLAAPIGTLHAAILRSPYAHAAIRAVDASPALALDGVECVLTGTDVAAWSRPFTVGVKAPMRHWALAVDRARYVGEPVAVVVARDRYLAEDALELIEVDWQPLDAAVDPEAAAGPGAPVLHEAVGGNVVSDRQFRYGEPERAFAEAERVVELTVRYPRSLVTPIECFGVVAEYDPFAGAYDLITHFQGPFALHPVMALALQVPGPKLRLRTPPHSGGSYGVKQGVAAYAVLIALAARKAGRPVKWIEDRLEHLCAAGSATSRLTRIRAAVDADGTIRALDYDNLEDCGAYLKAPEPATLYRMHGSLTGAYRVPHLAVRNRIVLTNKTPTGLNRGFGGPQMYFALERLVHTVADDLGLDRLEVIRRNLVPASAMPYRAAAGALYDSGDYRASVEQAVGEGGLAELEERRERARAEGWLYGIGFAAVVEPSVSNMGYITTVLTPEERERAGPKGGALAVATVTLDPLGGVSVRVGSTPQGQGHRTVLAQVVADVFGVTPGEVTVDTELDTGRDAWSIAAGNYSCRFAPAVAGTAHRAAMRLRERLARIAAARLNVPADDIRFAGGQVFAAGNPDNALAFRRLAGESHWSPGGLPEDVEPALRVTEHWTPPELEPPDAADRINGSLAYGFLFDIAAVEIDRDTGQVRIDRYVTAHDAGRLLNPALADGQVRGGFANALGAALFEELRYAPDGQFLSGTFADYLVPTAGEVPEPVILHRETPSPFTPLGAKGIGEGNTMSTPACIANAVADALGRRDVRLPLTPARIAAMLDEGAAP